MLFENRNEQESETICAENLDFKRIICWMKKNPFLLERKNMKCYSLVWFFPTMTAEITPRVFLYKSRSFFKKSTFETVKPSVFISMSVLQIKSNFEIWLNT